jgi:RNA polymerase sigma factor (sigma-70 family)
MTTFPSPQSNHPNNKSKENTDNNYQQYLHYHHLTAFSRREREEYIIATWQHLETIYRFYKPKQFRAHSASELVSFAIEKVIKNADVYMRRYRTPEHCANAVARTSAKDHRRRELADRGHGARNTRRGEELDAPIAVGDDGGTMTLGDLLMAPEGNPEAIVDVITLEEEIVALLSDASDEELFLIHAIFAEERPHGDIAKELGVRRETIVRRYGRLIKRLQEKGFDTNRLEETHLKTSDRKISDRKPSHRKTSDRKTKEVK